MPTLLIATLFVLTASVVTALWLSRQHRRRVLARVRAEWGRPLVRRRKTDAIADYHRSLAAAGSPSLDDRTWSDLDLDAVFAAVDRTESTLGQQALYHRLRTSPAADNLSAFDALATRFADDVPARERAQVVLSRLQDPAGYDLWWLAQPGSLEKKSWQIVYPIFSAFILGCLLAIPFWPAIFIVPVSASVINLLIRVRTRRRVSAIVNAFRQLYSLIVAGETLAFLKGADIEAITGPLSAELGNLRRLKAATRWVSRDPMAMVEPLSLIIEYLNVLLLLDVNAVYFGARELEASSASLRRVITAVGDIDAAIAVASFRTGATVWTRPGFEPAGAPMVLREIAHPLVSEAVPNSIVLGPPHGLLVTGSNMSGKSTFLRTLGVNAVLAQTINTCLARSYESPVLHVRSCIGRSDDLIAGKSYYLVEVEAVLSLVRASADSEMHLFLFDELFRGTNAVERIAAAEAVLIELIAGPQGAGRHLVIAATHDGELVDLLREHYVSYHFRDSLGPDGLVFEYLLQPGPATSRNAIALLQLSGAPEAVVQRALARASVLDGQRRSVLD